MTHTIKTWQGLTNQSDSGIKPPRKKIGPKRHKQSYQAKEKFIESSQDNFFGFNTANVKDRSLFSGILESVKYLYESIIEDYMGDVYTDVIEGYTIATIKVRLTVVLSVKILLNINIFS